MKEYQENSTSNGFEVLVEETNLSNGEVFTTECLVPSSNLSQYAHNLAKAQIKTVASNLLTLEKKVAIQDEDAFKSENTRRQSCLFL